jgi:hypothetical protein
MQANALEELRRIIAYNQTSGIPIQSNQIAAAFKTQGASSTGNLATNNNNPVTSFPRLSESTATTPVISATAEKVVGRSPLSVSFGSSQRNGSNNFKQ